MKKPLILISILVIFLVACSENKLEGFTQNYNEKSEVYGIPALDAEEYGEIEKEENMSWQKLFESKNYTIDAKYKDGENLSGYHLAINHENQPYEKLEGVGYKSSIAIAEALNLNVDQFIKEYETALTTSSHSYTDGDYLIDFTYPGKDSLTSVGMIINYDKQ